MSEKTQSYVYSEGFIKRVRKYLYVGIIPMVGFTSFILIPGIVTTDFVTNTGLVRSVGIIGLVIQVVFSIFFAVTLEYSKVQNPEFESFLEKSQAGSIIVFPTHRF